ncbi:hypothetical protein SO802_017510 [Lithocarpus litseifolius]|uniref:Uncharacterized protein n=1 Tax=Lithocarpus litseifolius TaxID=425828 RepID=A0AAW2CKH6_9ROSI
MAKREGLLGSSGAGTIGVVVPGGEAVVGGEAKVVAMGVGEEARQSEPLFPLQDPRYCLTSLFPTVGDPKVSPPSVSKKWILKEDEENEKVVADFYPLVEGQSLMEAIVEKYPHFMTKCKLRASLRKSGLQLLVAVLLDMQRTKLESSNLKKALEWKNVLKDLLFMKFGVQYNC